MDSWFPISFHVFESIIIITYFYTKLSLAWTVGHCSLSTSLLPYFLAYDVPGSPCTVSTPALDSAISPRCPVSLDSLAESLVENGI